MPTSPARGAQLEHVPRGVGRQDLLAQLGGAPSSAASSASSSMFTSEPAACVIILPSAILESLPIMPTMCTRRMPAPRGVLEPDADEVADLDERLLGADAGEAPSRTLPICPRS